MRLILQLPAAVKLFLATELCFGFGTGIWNLNFNFHLKELGFSEVDLGTIAAFGSVSVAMVSVIAGRLCDRIGYHPAMVLGCLLKASGMAIIAALPGMEFAFAGQLISGIGDAFILPSEFPFLLSLVDEKYKSLVYNLLICAYLFAMFFGNLAGGYLPLRTNWLTTRYEFSLLLSSLSFAMIGAGRYFLPRRKIESESKALSFSILKEKKLVWFLLYGVAGMMVFNMISSMVNIVYRKHFGLQDSVIGVLFSVSTLASCIAVFLLPVIIKGFKNYHTAVAVLTLNSITLAVMSLAGMQLFASLWIGFNVLRITLPGLVDSPMLQSMPENKQGTYSGMRIFANNIGMGLGAVLSGVFISSSRFGFLLLTASFVTVLQLVIYWKGCSKYIGCG